MTPQVDERLWPPAHALAAILSQWGTDPNLLKTAGAYMKEFPEADLVDWLDRLVRLGDLFSSSQQTGRYRQQLQAACQRTAESFLLCSGDEWAWVLGWAARLMPHYQDHLKLAQRIAPVEPFVPTMVSTFRRSKQWQQESEKLPEVHEEVSEKAQSLFDQLQSKWGKREE